MAVRHYNLTFTTVGPVHIGDGGSYGKKDYFAEKGKVVVLDARKFVSKLNEEQMVDYLAFLQETNSSIGLQELLNQHDDLRRIALSSVRYQTETSLAKAPRGSRNFYDVATCVKDAYDMPYIPGSSVKGMLRTAILTSMVLEERGKYASLYDKQAARNAYKNADARLEREAFWREVPCGNQSDIVNDIMKYVSVADSQPLSVSDLVFVQKYDKFAKTDKGEHKKNMGRLSDNEGNKLNIYRECIKPGVEIKVQVDIDDRIDAYLSGACLDIDGLQRVFEDWLTLYSRCFESCFDAGEEAAKNTAASDDGRCQYIYQGGPLEGNRCRNAAVGNTEYCNTHKDKANDVCAGKTRGKSLTCYLGGGVGFASKTVLNALFSNDDERIDEVAHILFKQFPSKFVPQRFRGLEERSRNAGFESGTMRQRGKQAKNDHRHWMSAELGVAPHTLKMGILGEQKYPMGKCVVKIEER